MDTDARHDEPLYTRHIDGVLFQLDAAGGLAFVDVRDGDAARLVALDARQHLALATFYTGLAREAREAGQSLDADAEARVRAMLRFLEEPPSPDDPPTDAG